MTRLPFLACALLLAACSAAPVGTTATTAQSPREVDVTVLNTYAAALATASGAIDSGKLAAGTQRQIAAASDATTKAVEAYSAEAMKCVRDQTTGIVGDAPADAAAGVHCAPSTVTELLAAANTQIGTLTGLLTAFGFKVSTGSGS